MLGDIMGLIRWVAQNENNVLKPCHFDRTPEQGVSTVKMARC